MVPKEGRLPLDLERGRLSTRSTPAALDMAKVLQTSLKETPSVGAAPYMSCIH